MEGSSIEYIVKVLIYAGAYAFVASLLFPGEHTVFGLVIKGLIIGAIAQYLTDWRERRISEGKTPYHPELRLWGGAIGLAFSGWCFSAHSPEDPWFYLLLYAGLAVFCLWVVAESVKEMRRAQPPAKIR